MNSFIHTIHSILGAPFVEASYAPRRSGAGQAASRVLVCISIESARIAIAGDCTALGVACLTYP